MRRLMTVAVFGGLTAVLAGCYDVPVIPPKPTPAEIVAANATTEISREFAGKTDLKQNLGKFLEKLGEAKTTNELYAAWATVYPDHPRVINRTIDKSMRDFYWPVAPVTAGRVYVEGVRKAAEDLSSS